jgi:hypothetical protein
MTAAKDNETLDHLLSVVNDAHNVRDPHRIAKPQDGRSRGREPSNAKRLDHGKVARPRNRQRAEA